MSQLNDQGTAKGEPEHDENTELSPNTSKEYNHVDIHVIDED